MYNKTIKLVLHFVNTILIAIVYMVIRSYLAGYNVLSTKAFIDYSSTIFIEAMVVSAIIVAIIYFIIRKKHGNKTK